MNPLAATSRGGLPPDPGHPPGGDGEPGERGTAAPPPGRRGVVRRHTRFAACALASGPKLARARTSAGSTPSVTSPQHGHAFACATYSVTTGGGGGSTSVTWWRRCAVTGAPARPCPHPRTPPAGTQNRSSGSSTSFIVVPGSPGCFPGGACPAPAATGPAPFFLYGLSDEGGFEEVEESLPPGAQVLHLRGQAPDLRGQLADQPVRVSQPRRQLPADSADSSSAEGKPGTSGTAGNDHHPGPPVNNPGRRVDRHASRKPSSRNPPRRGAEAKALTLAE